MPRTATRSQRPTNRLLAAIPLRDYRRLVPDLSAVSLHHGQSLCEPGEPIGHAYFPETALVSVLALMDDGAQVEAGMIGNEGLTGAPLLLGSTSSPFRVAVQIPGMAYRLEADVVRTEMKRSGRFAELVHRYLAAFLTQVSQSAGCNGHHPVEKRCCRWLLAAHDRAGSAELPLTQEYLAALLSVRRSGVGQVAASLQEAGLIRYSRGRVTILDRAGLQARACECYRIVRLEFDSLLEALGSASRRPLARGGARNGDNSALKL